MKELRKIYKARWFARRKKLHWRAPIVCGAIKDVLEPRSVIDVGCATGDLVAGFNDLEVPAWGLEGCDQAKEYLVCDPARVIWHDLRIPFELHVKPYSLTVCFEVAEHIEPEYANVFIDNIISLAPAVLMSAAPPGQGGLYHVNCREPEWWIRKFRDRNYERYPDVEARIKEKWHPWRNKPGIKAYYQNLLFFELN